MGVTALMDTTSASPSFFAPPPRRPSFSNSDREAAGREWGRVEHQREVSSGRLATAEKTGSVINRERRRGGPSRLRCYPALAPFPSLQPSPPSLLAAAGGKVDLKHFVSLSYSADLILLSGAARGSAR